MIMRNIILTLMMVFIFTSCTFIHTRGYNIVIPEINKETKDINNNKVHMKEALEIIKNIANKYSMKEYIHYNNKDKLSLYYITGSDDIQPQRTVHIEVKLQYDTNNIKIWITDIHRSSQSPISKNIERDLIEAVQKKFGEDSIIPE